MAQLFNLSVSDGSDTLTFFSTSQGSGTRYQLADGGFQVGLPQASRDFGVLRPGIGIMINESYSARECTILFSIYATSRSGAVSQVHRVNNLLKNVSQRARTGRGERVELKYAWEGAGNATYLEVYGGELIFPDELWSVEGIHGEIYGEYVVPNLVLKLWLSPDAWKISPRSTSMTAVPLSNSYGSNNTSGLRVKNTGTNYVTISGGSVDGDAPCPIKVTVDPGDANYYNYDYLYMGLQRELTGYPTNLFYDSASCVRASGSTFGGGYGGSYRALSFGGSSVPIFQQYSWEYNNTKGLFLAITTHNRQNLNPNYTAWSMGFDDYVTYGIRVQSDWHEGSYSYSTVCGVIDLPPGAPELASLGTFHEDLWIGTWIATTQACTVYMDYIEFLPIGDGVRMWVCREATGGGSAVDDGWQGLEYVSGGGKVWLPFHGALEPLKLVPGVNQRIYFKTIGTANYQEHNREIKVRVSYVPAYRTMVE